MSLQFCPHCGNTLTALDTETAPLHCPACGASLAMPSAAPLAGEPDAALAPDELPIMDAIVREEDDDSATRAVTRERLAPIVAQVVAEHERALRGNAFDETTRPAAYAAAPMDAAEAARAHEMPHETTQALPFDALPPEEQESTTAPKRRSLASLLRGASVALVALALVAVVVVAALAANGVIGDASTGAIPATALATSTVAPTATPAGVAFRLPGYYQITLPQGWTTQQRNTPPASYAALLTAPTGVASVNVEAQRAAGLPTLATLDEQFLGALAQQGTGQISTGTPTSVTLAGQTWTQIAEDAQLRLASGQTPLYAHVVALSTQRGAYVYTIVYLAPSQTAAAAGPAFTTANQAYFQPMLESFAFLG